MKHRNITGLFVVLAVVVSVLAFGFAAPAMAADGKLDGTDEVLNEIREAACRTQKGAGEGRRHG